MDEFLLCLDALGDNIDVLFIVHFRVVMGGGARRSEQEQEDAANQEDETTSNDTTNDQTRGNETTNNERGVIDSSNLGMEGSEATPSAGSSEETMTLLKNEDYKLLL